jgi:hypothetical protein
MCRIRVFGQFLNGDKSIENACTCNRTKTVQNVTGRNCVDPDRLGFVPFDPASVAKSQLDRHASFVQVAISISTLGMFVNPIVQFWLTRIQEKDFYWHTKSSDGMYSLISFIFHSGSQF